LYGTAQACDRTSTSRRVAEPIDGDTQADEATGTLTPPRDERIADECAGSSSPLQSAGERVERQSEIPRAGTTARVQTGSTSTISR
jgi:hypothetical protein